MTFYSVNVLLPEVGLEVLGFSQEWIDEDSNPEGVCVCFLDGEGDWYIAQWCLTHDEWHTHYTGYTQEELDEKSYALRNPPQRWTYKPKMNY